MRKRQISSEAGNKNKGYATMKYIYGYIFLIFAFFGLSLDWWSDSSFDAMNLPRLTEFIEDYSHILSSTDLTNLRNQAKNHEKNTSEQAVTILFPNRGGYELADIGLKVFRENGIGQKTTNNWILLLIATEEKKIRIITGYGMDSKVPDILAKKWIEEDIRPKVDVWDYAWAIWIFYKKLWEDLIQTPEWNLSKETTQNPPPELMIFLGLWWFFGILARFLIENRWRILWWWFLAWIIMSTSWYLLSIDTFTLWGILFLFWLFGVTFWKRWIWGIWWRSGGGFSGRWGSSGWGWAWD